MGNILSRGQEGEDDSSPGTMSEDNYSYGQLHQLQNEIYKRIQHFSQHKDEATVNILDIPKHVVTLYQS